LQTINFCKKCSRHTTDNNEAFSIASTGAGPVLIDIPYEYQLKEIYFGYPNQ
jgi:thiamine pyrophosphate-dependent acetolactate synthase large subunit-like protein